MMLPLLRASHEQNRLPPMGIWCPWQVWWFWGAEALARYAIGRGLPFFKGYTAYGDKITAILSEKPLNRRFHGPAGLG